MNYKSKHTGAQVDEAVSKVLNGEVGGGATPDWNAQAGEAGYIENRTHYVTGTIETINLNGEWDITKTNINVNDDSTIDISWNIDFMGNHTEGSCRFTGIDESNFYSFDNGGFNIDFQNHGGLIDLNMQAFSGGDPHYGTVTIGVDMGHKTLDEVYIPDTIARKSDIPVPIIINYNTIKDAANSEVNTISEQTWLKYIANDTYKNYDWIIQRDGIKYNCTVIPDYDNEHIQILYFTRNEIEGTSGPLGNAIMKYSGLRIQLLPYTENTYLIYKISNGGSLETREFVFGENYNTNAYLIAAAQMSGIDTIDCKWVYTTKDDKTITVNGQYFHIENSITNVDAIFSVKDKSLTYVDGNGLINKVTFADNGSYDISKNNPDIPDTVIKTTPQSLSDDDKNQALANLGIDPVVWKYLCNPYIIEPENTLPDYLRQLLVNRNPLILNLCKIKVEVDVYDDIADATRTKTYFCTPMIDNYADDELPAQLECIIFYDNTYHTYYVEIDESDGQIYDITEIVTNENNS